jgi:aerobic carbon-monoxide dehydrogenase small subunit
VTATVPGAGARDGSIEIELTVNGQTRTVLAEPMRRLSDLLRDDLGLTGTKECCLVGECGACTVLVDGRSVDSCLMLAVEADGATVTTVEGLATGDRLHPLQQAFLDTGAAQCGFCIPGQLVSAEALLAVTPHPTRAGVEEGLAGNLCRCAGYEQIIEAVLAAAGGALHHTKAATPPVGERSAVPDATLAPQ